MPNFRRSLQNVIFVVLIFFAGNLVAQEKPIVILLSSDYVDFRKAKIGFKTTLKKLAKDENIHEPQFKEIIFEKKKRKLIKEQIELFNPILIFAIGNSAARFAVKDLSKFQIIFAMVTSPEKYEISAPPIETDLGGVVVDIDYSKKLQILHHLFGSKLEIATVYSESSFSEADQIKSKARSLGIRFVSYPIRGPNEINQVIRKLKKNTLFWILPDHKIYTNKTLGPTLKNLKKKGLFIYAPTERFLRFPKTPADIAISIDPEENGQQAGMIAIKALTEKTFEIESPEKIRCFVRKGLKINLHETVTWIK